MDTKQRSGPTPTDLVRNELLMRTRSEFMRFFFDPRRDISAECGHPLALTNADYVQMDTRGDVASRVISIFPEETWSQPPEILETDDPSITDFEGAWSTLAEEMNILADLELADTLSGVGRYGILLLGIDDGRSLAEPVDGLDVTGKTAGPEGTQLLYLRPLDESVITINDLERDEKSARFGLPTSYNIQFSDNVVGSSSIPKTVHWHRVIHLADNRRNSQIFGEPRLKRVFNRILDLHKTAGGSGEMFWKGGFPGLSLQSHPTANEDISFDAAATKQQMDDYMNGLQRYIATLGMDVKSLGVQVADPRPHVEVQLKMIATTLAVPWRVFVGSESAHLASSQDSTTWNRRLAKRRRNYINPHVLRPFINRLIGMGVLPMPKQYRVWWPDLETPGDEAKANVAEKRSNAIAKYVTTGADLLMSPYYFFTLVLGMDDNQANAIIKQDLGTTSQFAPAPAPVAAPGGTPGAAPTPPARGKKPVPSGPARNGH